MMLAEAHVWLTMMMLVGIGLFIVTCAYAVIWDRPEWVPVGMAVALLYFGSTQIVHSYCVEPVSVQEESTRIYNIYCEMAAHGYERGLQDAR